MAPPGPPLFKTRWLRAVRIAAWIPIVFLGLRVTALAGMGGERAAALDLGIALILVVSQVLLLVGAYRSHVALTEQASGQGPAVRPLRWSDGLLAGMGLLVGIGYLYFSVHEYIEKPRRSITRTISYNQESAIQSLFALNHAAEIYASSIGSHDEFVL